MLYAFLISMDVVSYACLNWLGGTGGKFAWFLACAPTFWPAHLPSGLLTWFWPCTLNYCLPTTILACAIDSWLAQLNLDYGFNLCRCNSTDICLKCRVWAQPHQTALCDDDTQQPNFLMEFRGGNDGSSVALISLIIYSSLGPFRLLLLWFLNKWIQKWIQPLVFLPPGRICISGKMNSALNSFSTWC